MDLTIERFITAFKDYVQRSPVYYAYQKLETCIGCLQAPADVKINRRCISPPPHFKFGPKPCQQCNCRVLWCASCMARWWASRQDGPAERWLAGRATCPMCRASFCLLDVSPAKLDRNKLSSSGEDEVQHLAQGPMPTRDHSLPRLWNLEWIAKQISPIPRFITTF